MRNFLTLALIGVCILLAACGSAVPTVKPFKMDIQQGNVVTSKMLLQLRPGMTKSQVRFIMGTPLIADSFHSNRWDYFYQMRQAGKIIEQRRVILEFDKELLTRVRGDVVPQGTAGAEPAQDGNITAAKSVTPPPKKEEGVLDKLKFWKSDEKEAVKPALKAESAKPKEEKGLLDKLKFWKKDETASAKEVAPAAKPADVPSGGVPGADAAGSDAAAADTPSLLAVPIGGVAAMPDAPTSDAVAAPEPTSSQESAPPAATPKAEVVETPVAEPKAPSAKVEAKPVEPASIETKPAETKPVAAKPATAAAKQPVKANQNEPFIFRMDKNLDLRNLDANNLNSNNSQTPPAATAEPSVNTKKVETPPPPPEEAPGYFERMLEKIGF